MRKKPRYELLGTVGASGSCMPWWFLFSFLYKSYFEIVFARHFAYLCCVPSLFLASACELCCCALLDLCTAWCPCSDSSSCGSHGISWCLALGCHMLWWWAAIPPALCWGSHCDLEEVTLLLLFQPMSISQSSTQGFQTMVWGQRAGGWHSLSPHRVLNACLFSVNFNPGAWDKAISVTFSCSLLHLLLAASVHQKLIWKNTAGAWYLSGNWLLSLPLFLLLKSSPCSVVGNFLEAAFHCCLNLGCVSWNGWEKGSIILKSIRWGWKWWNSSWEHFLIWTLVSCLVATVVLNMKWGHPCGIS